MLSLRSVSACAREGFEESRVSACIWRQPLCNGVLHTRTHRGRVYIIYSTPESAFTQFFFVCVSFTGRHARLGLNGVCVCVRKRGAERGQEGDPGAMRELRYVT